MGEELNFEALMPKEKGSMKSLNEFLREQRVRLNRTPDDIKDCNKLVKRGGYSGQFVEENNNG